MALAALAGGLLVSSWGGGSVGAVPKPTHAKPLTAKVKGVKGGAQRTEYAQAQRKSPSGSKRDAGRTSQMPRKGPVAVLLELNAQPSSVTYRANAGRGRAAAKLAASAQNGRIRALQGSVEAQVRAVAPRSRVLYESRGLVAGVALQTDASNVSALRAVPGVKAVHPIATKHLSNAGAIPLLGGPAAWQTYGDLGQDTTVGVIDSGIDYTHADFGGPGTLVAFNDNPRTTVDPSFFPTAKVIGGHDFAGDDYNADPTSTDPVYPYQPVPTPDPNPIDCRYAGPDSTVGHGTHVAGTLAGVGVTSAGATYGGPYDTSTPFGSLRIGPGVAPRASLYALRVFGCAGSTNLVGAALEWAADPNGDGDFSDRLDVVNMSLGSDFGSPEDGDALASNALAQLGTVVVASIGNGSDVYDVGGSPGNAQRVLAAAGVDDGFAVLDALRKTAPGPQTDYAGSLSVLYDYLTRPGVTGQLSLPLSTANADGCDPFSTDDAAKVDGKIAYLLANNFTRCGSIGRTGNAEAAGAVGVVIVDDTDGLETGINGNQDIPAILVEKSTGDILAPQLAGGVTVTFGPETKSVVHRNLSQNADKVYSASSRGTHGNGHLKPDVAAVGVQVFSVDAGSGAGGKTLSGTSMSSPQVAGTAALVRSKHPDWTTEEVKADIMNTADKDVFTGDSRTGDKYAPNRVGSGRVDIPPALANQVVAYVQDDPGAVSVSFGPVAVTGPVTMSKTVKVVNKGVTAAAFDLAYQPITSVPGVSYLLTDPTTHAVVDHVTLSPRAVAKFAVTLKIDDPSALTKTIDPTVGRTQDIGVAVPRQYLADASGRVVLTATDSARPSLRVPVYSAPRPASVMTTPAELHMPAGNFPTADLQLVGQGVDQGSGNEQVVSVVSGYALQGTSGQLGPCTVQVAEHCVGVPDDRGIDLKYVGVTTDAPAVKAFGGDPVADGFTYFAVTTWGPWRTPVGSTDFRVEIDTNGDGTPDEELITTRFTDTDIMVTVLQDIQTGEFLTDAGGNNAWFVNGLPGDIDTDVFDSDSLVLPVATQAMTGMSLSTPPAQPRIAPGHSRVKYGVFTTSGYHSEPVDLVGLTNAGQPTLTVDVLRPALTATDGVSADQFYADLPGLPLSIRKDVPSYRIDKTLGLLLIHHHNTDGARGQVVKIKQPSSPRLTLSRTTIRAGQPVLASVAVPGSAGPAPTGRIYINRNPGVVLVRGTLSGSANGYFAAFLPRLPHGRYLIYADYPGDNNYLFGRSNVVLLQVV